MIAKPTKRFQVLLTTIVVLTALLGSSLPAAAQDNAPELFGTLNGADMPPSNGDDPQVKRARYASVDIATLFDTAGKPRRADSLPAVTLNLFADAQFTGEIRQVKSDEWGTTWQGNLKNQANGYFYLTVAEDVFIAHVASPLGVYEVSFAGSNLYKIVELDQSKFKDHPGEVHDHSAAQIFSADTPTATMDSMSSQADSASRIDILVVYTRDARIAEGSTDAMKARIKLALDETNSSYSLSGITTKLRLVHVEEISYTESGDMELDVDRLRINGDGHMDNVHSLRNRYAADMVALIVENGGGFCGMSADILATATTAFQVTARTCATGYYSFGHEFGHLQGARHDPYVDSVNTPFSYGHGFVRLNANPAKRWRTVMAYEDRCLDVGLYTCNRLIYWSNPDVLYNGLPTGSNPSQNARVLNETAGTVANFRTQKIASDFNSSFNVNLNGWTGVSGIWKAGHLSKFLRSVGVANEFTSIKRNGTYGDLTYEVRMRRSGVCTGCANGIIIRGKPTRLSVDQSWRPSYVFQYSNAGSFSVYEILSDGNAVELQGWTLSGAIVQGGWNKLKVIAVGNSLKFYINGVLVWSGSDNSLKTGQVGISFFRTDAKGALLVDWAKLSTTATADFNPFEAVKPGIELEGGSITHSP